MQAKEKVATLLSSIKAKTACPGESFSAIGFPREIAEVSARHVWYSSG